MQFNQNMTKIIMNAIKVDINMMAELDELSSFYAIPSLTAIDNSLLTNESAFVVESIPLTEVEVSSPLV